MSIVTYYCGEETLVKVSVDEGVSWITRNHSPGSPGILYDIMAWPMEPDKVTTVGNFGVIETSTNQGVTFNNASPVYGAAYTFEEVWNIDSNNSVVVGWEDLGFGTTRPVFLKSTNGGVSYTLGQIRDSVNIGTDIFKNGKATSVHFLSDQVGVISVVGVLETLSGYPPPLNNKYCFVLLTLDGGITWTVTNNKQPLNFAPDNAGNGIKISYDYSSSLYIINVVTRTNIFRSMDSGVTYNITDPTTKGQHLTWIGDSYVWYTEQSSNRINQSLNIGGTWNIQQSGIPSTAGRGAHFYQGPIIITGYYTSGDRLYKSLDQGITGFVCDNAPNNKQIWAVWTEQTNPYKCYLLQDCTNQNIQYVFTDNGFLQSCGFDFPSNIGNTITIASQAQPNLCPEVADGVTCWLIVQEVPCGNNFCNQVIS
jgi:hypothetical protein